VSLFDKAWLVTIKKARFPPRSVSKISAMSPITSAHYRGNRSCGYLTPFLAEREPIFDFPIYNKTVHLLVLCSVLKACVASSSFRTLRSYSSVSCVSHSSPYPQKRQAL
jgi:hypothetical protein